MASRVESKLARPIPADRMRSLESRWDQIGKDAAALEGKPIDPKKLAELDDLRMGNSRTVTGREGLEEAARAEANWKKANEQVGEWVRNGDDVSVERINKLNEIVGDGLTHNGGIPGQLRPEGMDSAAGHISRLYLPGGAEVESSMGNYMSWYGANKNMPPVQLAGESYQRLVSIHPYADGNGRTTRLVADWILQKNGLPPAAMGSAEKNVAVFGFHELAPDVCPRANAVEAVTSGVEKSLSILGGK
jgi:Fic family protein